MDAVLRFGIEFDVEGAVEGVEELEEAAGGVGDGLAERLSGASEAIGELGREGSRSSRALQGFASVVSMISPQAGAALRAVSALTRGLSILKLGLGPVAIGLAAVTAAVMLYQRQQAAADAVRERSIALAEASKVADDKLAAAREALAVATGEMSAEEAKINAIRRQGMLESLPEFKKYVEAVSAEQGAVENLRDRLEGLNAQREKSATRAAQEAGRMGENTDGVRAAAKGHEQLTTNISRTRAELTAKEKDLESAQKALAAYHAKVKETIQTEVDVVEITKENEDAVKSLAAAEKRRAEQLKLVAIAQQNAADHAKAYESALGALREMAADATSSQLSGIDAVIDARDRALAQAREEFRVANDTARTQAEAAAAQAQYTAARVALEQQATTEIERIRVESLEKISQKQEQLHQEEMRRKEEERQFTIDVFNETGSLFGSLSSIAATAARAQAETDRKAAEQALEVSKKLAVAEATASLASGTMNAAARYAGRPIATGIAITALLAQYGAQLAAIKATKLHQGGLGLMPDERIRGQHVVLEPERTLSPEGTRNLGEDGARRLERGEPARVISVPVPVFKHFGLFSAEEVRRDSPTSRAIAAGPTSGQVPY